MNYNLPHCSHCYTIYHLLLNPQQELALDAFGSVEQNAQSLPGLPEHQAPAPVNQELTEHIALHSNPMLPPIHTSTSTMDCMIGDGCGETPQHKEQQTERMDGPTDGPTNPLDTQIGSVQTQHAIPLLEVPTDNLLPLLNRGDKGLNAASQLRQSPISQTVGLTDRLVLIRSGRSTTPLQTRVSNAAGRPQSLHSPEPPDVQTSMLTAHNPNKHLPTHHSQSASSRVEDRMQAVFTLLSLHQLKCAAETQRSQERLPEPDGAIEPPTLTQGPEILNRGAGTSKSHSLGRTEGGEAYSTLPIAHPQPDTELLPAQIAVAHADQPASSTLAPTMNNTSQSQALQSAGQQQQGCIEAPTPSIILSEQRRVTDCDPGRSQSVEAWSEDLSAMPLSAAAQPRKCPVQPESRRSSLRVAELIAEMPALTLNNQSLDAQRETQPIPLNVPQTQEGMKICCRPSIILDLDMDPDVLGTCLPRPKVPIEGRSVPL